MPDPADTGTGETAFFGRQSVYDFTSRIFPDDLGQEDMAHYMIININVPTKTSGGGESKGRLPNGSFLTGAEGLSKVDRLRFGGNGQLNIGGDAEIPNFLIGGPGGFGTLLPEGTTFGDIPGFNVAQDFIAPQRRTTRIKESIALHMPNGGLVYTEENKYEEVSMTAVLTGAISTAVGLIPGAASPFNSAVSAAKRGAQIAGYPINPAVEVLFAARPQRQWMFEVFLLPRSEKEVQSVKNIIRTLRYYAAPEITLGGFAFVPPADFDITFFQAGKENTNLPRINTCVLDRIDVDYSPEQSYSTFANGHPVAVRLSLGFREVEILHKERVLQGF
jgi:hypothetical protein